MARKILPLCVAVVMIAGVAQAVEYIPPTFTTSTATWGDITIVGASLDSVGTDYTPAEYVNTVAADGATDWVGNLDGANTGPAYIAAPYWETATQEPNGLDPLPFGLFATDAIEPELITTVTVPEGWYQVFVPYCMSIYARLSDDRDFIPITGDDVILGEVVPVGTVVMDPWGNKSEVIDHTQTRTNERRALIASVGYMYGTELTLRTSVRNRAGSIIPSDFPQTVLYGIGYQAVTDVIVVDQSEGQTVVTEGGAADTITVTLTDQPTADVTITLTPDSAAYVLSDVELVFTSADWAAKTVTVTAADDGDGDNHSGSIAISVSSADEGYGSDVIAPVAVTVLDDDVPAAIPGLIGWWKLDGNGLDSSGYGNHLTMVDEPEPNHPDWSFDIGVDGLALHTNKDGAPYFEVSPADPNFYVPEGGLTISYWVLYRPYSYGSGWGWHVAIGTDGDNDTLVYMSRYWGKSSFNAVLRADNDGGCGVGDLNTPLAEEPVWRHFVTVWDKDEGGRCRAYLDGALIDTQPAWGDNAWYALRPNTTNLPLRIAYGGNPSWLTTNTWIDDVRIYDHGLTPYEVGSLNYEVTGEFVCTEIDPEDLNGDCEVNMQDFALIAAKWLKCNKVPQAACGN